MFNPLFEQLEKIIPNFNEKYNKDPLFNAVIHMYLKCKDDVEKIMILNDLCGMIQTNHTMYESLYSKDIIHKINVVTSSKKDWIKLQQKTIDENNFQMTYNHIFSIDFGNTQYVQSLRELRKDTIEPWNLKKCSEENE